MVMKPSARKKYLWSPNERNWYVRLSGKLIPIKAEYGTEAFDAEYWAIRSGRKAESLRSWSALIKAFREDPHGRWSEFSPRYRSDLEPVFAYIEDKLGKIDVARLRQVHIIEAMDANKHRIRFANYLPPAFSMLCQFALRKRWREDNPAIGIKLLKVPKGKRKPHEPWPDWAVAKMRAEGSFEARLIFELGVGTVQRPGDLVDFTWGDFDGDNLKLEQNKTGVELILPCTRALRSMLDEARSRLSFAPHPSRHILTKQDGSRMNYRYMAAVMMAERKRLGLAAFDLHALRYRGVQELAAHGCTDDEIGAYSGHRTKDMIRKYAGQARQVARAQQAREKRQ